MRENTKWIMLVTALAFVALMVFEWGMDMSGRSAGGLGEIGRVNGSPVMYEDYMATYRQLYDQYQNQQEEPLTSQQNRQIEDEAFDQVVNQILIAQELERRGIRVTDDEIRQAARFNPPPEFRGLPLFQTDGQFDLQKYQQYIASPQVDDQTLLYLESYFRDIIPRGKLLRQVSSGIYLTDQELWRRYRFANEQVMIRFLALNPRDRVSDDAITITDDEVEDYYREHEEDFQVPARATVRAAILRKAPLPADTTAAVERAERVAGELRGGASWEELAPAESSDTQTAANGGDLGVVTPGQTVEPFDSATFQGPVGEVQGPVETQFGYHLIQVEERWAQDSAHVRHILVPIERTDESEIALLTRADSLEDLSEDMALEEAASRLGVEVVTAEITDAFAFLQGAGQVGEGADWAFEDAAPGDVSPVFENGQAFYALELVSSEPAGVMTLEEAEPTIREVLALQKKMAVAREEGEEIVSAIRGGDPLPTAAERFGVPVQTAGPFTRTAFVPGMGRLNAAVGASFGLEEGEVSNVVETEDNAFIIEVVERIPADRAAWEAQKEAQRASIEQTLEQQRLQQWLQGLRAQARIIDRRDEVLQPADEDQEPLRPQGGLF